IAYYQQALQVCTRDAFPQQWAMTQNNLGPAYSNRIQGDKAQNLEHAIACYQQALQVRTRDAFPQDWAGTQNNLGSAYQDRIQGDRAQNLEDAIAYYQQALQVYTRDAFPQQWAMTQNGLGNAYLYRIQGDRAQNLEDAIACYRNALTIYTPKAIPLECWRTGRNLGNLGFQQGNWQLAIEGYSQAIDAVENSRSQSVDEQRRQEILKESIGVYENLVQAYIQVGDIKNAIETTERSRCQRLVDLMATSDLYPEGEVPPLVQEYQQLQQQINNLRYRWQFPQQEKQLVGAKRDATPQFSQKDRQQIEQLEAEKQQIWQQIRRQDLLQAAQQQTEHLSLAQMQQLIPHQQAALLSFYTTKNDTHIFILKPGQSPQIFTCQGESQQELQQWILDNWSTPYRRDNSTWLQQMSPVLQQLSQRLHLDQLIQQHLQDIRELIIVPHLALHQIPFAALPIDTSQPTAASETTRHPATDDTRMGGKRKSQTANIATPTATRYLSDLFRLRVVPSCQILNFCHQRTDNTAPQSTIGIVEDATDDLYFTEYECDTLAQLYQVPSQQRLRRQHATTAKYQNLLAQVQQLHSSHHASSDLGNPLNSRLVLADGYLSLEQLLTWRFPQVQEVFLSCCETNLSTTELTDDILTISTGFLCIGVSSAISTLWAVNDLATAVFATLYYQQRRQHTTAAALQQAQQRLRCLTNEELERAYLPQIRPYLQNRLAREREALAAAEAQLKQRRQLSSEQRLSWKDEHKKRKKAVRRLTQLLEEGLSLFCQQRYPFAHPQYWAGFIVQGQ
uniref:CHAT domain-containing protein n=1 Tax=Geitlerinema sp. PCC 9228 TaxID=111611 RepID=UPI0008F9C1D5